VKRLLVVLLVGAAVLAPSAGASLAVKLDQSSVSTRIGEKFHFSSTVRTLGPQPVPDVVAHLNIVSLDPSVYVDPEDWSSHRTRYFGTFGAGEARRVEWTVQAVNSGRFVVYVAVVDRDGQGSVTASNPLATTVAQKRRLNSGGVVPLALGIPGLLGLGFVVVRRRRRSLISLS
jgi:LPXTG-motif cell wall-anchored protein